MTEQGSVRFGGTTIQYHVRRSARRRKTVDITVDGAGVQVAVPQDTPDEDVRAIVRRKGTLDPGPRPRDPAGGAPQGVRQRGDAALPGPQRAHGRLWSGMCVRRRSASTTGG